MKEDLNQRIVARGKSIFAAIGQERPSLYDSRRWLGRVLEECMANDAFRLQMFRFVDVFPSLRSSAALTRHLEEYFGSDNDIPALLRTGAKLSGLGGRIGGAFLARAVRRNMRDMARQFILGETPDDMLPQIESLRRNGYAVTIDLLGEATLSDVEAEDYVTRCLDVLDTLYEAAADWPAPEKNASFPDWGDAPRINLSVKPTACYARTRPVDFDGSVAGIVAQLRRIYQRVIEVNGFLCIDMESYQYKDITLEAYRQLRREFPAYPHLGIALQAYLRDTENDVEELLAWAQDNELPVSVRLVKGAYWDFETICARQNGWPLPVFGTKDETDATFERLARRLLENHQLCHLACASHNIRSVAMVLETARELDVPPNRYEFQLLYGMAEPVRDALREAVGRVRLYCPGGELTPGLAYLVRRLLENTANASFLRQSFVETVDQDRLLKDPADQAIAAAAVENREPHDPDEFRNEPQVDFSRAEQRAAFRAALQRVRAQFGRDYPLLINGQEVPCAVSAPSLNPAAPDEVVGRIHQAGPEQVNAAVAAANAAAPLWRRFSARERADCLLQAAEIARGRIFDLAAWQVLEVGKQWDQAYADVAEAIDFLVYYSHQALKLARPRPSGAVPGEENLTHYAPRGVAAVIAPWNFPLAISCGMSAAALATGNTVVYKPSNLSAAVGFQLCALLHEAGLPPGVFNYLPGSGHRIGDALVGHPDIDLVAFTGSMEVGLGINAKAARTAPTQTSVKKVIAEMGGKNAIIVDDDADLDEAVPAVLASAFAFQGQKCSACSRAIVLEEIYPRFIERLLAAAAALKIGPAEDPANVMGPMVNSAAREKVENYLALAAQEGRVLYTSPVPADGFYAPLTIVEGIEPHHRLAQEEIFGPVLAVMKAHDFDQALKWANATRFALTGGVFSRSPSRLQRARNEFAVGNLYLNRGITGALVECQPFGGFNMSGIGSKAGGPDYLLQFVVPRTVTENTMRRGFAPDTAG